jgi:PAS domain S-box-containing protein
MASDPMADARALEVKLRDLLEAAPDAMVVVDAAGRIVLANQQCEGLFGYASGELPGRQVEDLVPDRFRGVHPGHREGYAHHAQRRPMGAGLELFGRRKDGAEFPAEISLSPIVLEQGGRFTIAAVRDVSASKALNERLRRQNEELAEQYRKAQEASRLKSEFLANMSHELRTPLNAVIGFAQIMFDGKVGPLAGEHREYLGDILTSSRHLLHLIEGILDLARIEAGKMQYRQEAVDVGRLVDDALAALRGPAAAKSIALSREVEPGLQGVTGDAGKLSQALTNYLSNAIKVTPEGGRVVVRVCADGPGAVRMEVEDSGIGIRPEDMERLFVEFQQLDAGTAKRYAGTGLGLALTKRFVEGQGGAVGVRSTPGGGSLFYAVLPRVPRDVTATPREE